MSARLNIDLSTDQAKTLCEAGNLKCEWDGGSCVQKNCYNKYNNGSYPFKPGLCCGDLPPSGVLKVDTKYHRATREIEENAFNGCSELKEVDLSDSYIYQIGASAFAGTSPSVVNLDIDVKNIPENPGSVTLGINSLGFKHGVLPLVELDLGRNFNRYTFDDSLIEKSPVCLKSHQVTFEGKLTSPGLIPPCPDAEPVCISSNAVGDDAKCNCDQSDPTQCRFNITGCELPCCANTKCANTMPTQLFNFKNTDCTGGVRNVWQELGPFQCKECTWPTCFICKAYDSSGIPSFERLKKGLDEGFANNGGYTIVYHYPQTASKPSEMCINVDDDSFLITNVPLKHILTLMPTGEPTTAFP